MRMLRLLISPSDRSCGALVVEEKHERGLTRQLADTLPLSGLAAPAFGSVWLIAG
jgi:hypothetical protein